jgi:hypothetical protein
MLPDLSNVLHSFEQTVTLKQVTQTISNFRPQETQSSSSIQAVIQVADPTQLAINDINYELRHIKIHTTNQIKNRDIIEYNGTDYRIISVQNYSDYGYFEAVANEVTQ